VWPWLQVTAEAAVAATSVAPCSLSVSTTTSFLTVYGAFDGGMFAQTDVPYGSTG
jgi:hypothetical protein